MVATIKLTHLSPVIVSFVCVCMHLCVVRTLKICSLNKFQGYNTVYLTLDTMLYIRSSELSHFKTIYLFHIELMVHLLPKSVCDKGHTKPATRDIIRRKIKLMHSGQRAKTEAARLMRSTFSLNECSAENTKCWQRQIMLFTSAIKQETRVPLQARSGYSPFSMSEQRLKFSVTGFQKLQPLEPG